MLNMMCDRQFKTKSWIQNQFVIKFSLLTHIKINNIWCIAKYSRKFNFFFTKIFHLVVRCEHCCIFILIVHCNKSSQGALLLLLLYWVLKMCTKYAILLHNGCVINQWQSFAAQSLSERCIQCSKNTYLRRYINRFVC